MSHPSAAALLADVTFRQGLAESDTNSPTLAESARGRRGT